MECGDRNKGVCRWLTLAPTILLQCVCRHKPPTVGVWFVVHFTHKKKILFPDSKLNLDHIMTLEDVD